MHTKDILISSFLYSILVFTEWEDTIIVELAWRISDDFVHLEDHVWLQMLKNANIGMEIEALQMARNEARGEPW